LKAVLAASSRVLAQSGNSLESSLREWSKRFDGTAGYSENTPFISDHMKAVDNTQSPFGEEGNQAQGGDPGLADIISSFLGTNNCSPDETPLPPKLCAICDIEVARWNEEISKTIAEEEERVRERQLIYDALACFASGALVGIVYALLED